MKRKKRLIRNRLRRMQARGDRCFYCGEKMQPHNEKKANFVTIDHVYPQSEGGIQTVHACLKCNQSKGNKKRFALKRDTIITVGDVHLVILRDTRVRGLSSGELFRFGLNPAVDPREGGK